MHRRGGASRSDRENSASSGSLSRIGCQGPWLLDRVWRCRGGSVWGRSPRYVSGVLIMSCVDLVRGLPRSGLVAAPAAAHLPADSPLLGDDLLGFVGGDRGAVGVADDIRHAALHDRPQSFRRPGRDHAACLEVVGAAFDHLLVVDAGQLGVLLAAQSAARMRVARVSREPALDIGAAAHGQAGGRALTTAPAPDPRGRQPHRPGTARPAPPVARPPGPRPGHHRRGGNHGGSVAGSPSRAGPRRPRTHRTAAHRGPGIPAPGALLGPTHPLTPPDMAGPAETSQALGGGAAAKCRCRH